MRCKVGDLAVIVSAKLFPEFVGLLCEVVGPAHVPEPGVADWSITIFGHRSLCGDGTYGTPDHCLRPLRDSDGADETLTWKDVPKGVPA